MDEAKGVINVMQDSRVTMVHFRKGAKLRGISGSCWPSHPTTLLSRSMTGWTGGGSFSLVFFRERRLRILRWVFLLAPVSSFWISPAVASFWRSS